MEQTRENPSFQPAEEHRLFRGSPAKLVCFTRAESFRLLLNLKAGCCCCFSSCFADCASAVRLEVFVCRKEVVLHHVLLTSFHFRKKKKSCFYIGFTRSLKKTWQVIPLNRFLVNQTLSVKVNLLLISVILGGRALLFLTAC